MAEKNFFNAMVEVEQAGAIAASNRPARFGARDNRLCAPTADQIRAVLADYFVMVGGSLEKRVMEDRVKRMVNIYRELAMCRCKLDDVTLFGLRHAKILLAKWQAEKLAKKTIYNRWTALRGWAVVLNKYGMISTIEEVWPEFHEGKCRTPVQNARRLTGQQIQARSDYLRLNGDKTAYLVDRLTREIGMTREDALEIDLAQAMLVAKGQSFLRASRGGNTRVYQMQGNCWWELFAEAAEFMKERRRDRLGWPHVEGTAAIAKFALRMSYVTRTMFSKEKTAAARNAAKEA